MNQGGSVKEAYQTQGNGIGADEATLPAPRVYRGAGFAVRDLHLAPTSAPARVTPEHSLVLHCGPSADLEWFERGHTHRRTLHAGDVSIHSAGDLPAFRLHQTAHLLEVTLSPRWIADVLHGTLNTPVPSRYGVRDLPIQHVAMALQADLVSGNPRGGLFAESLAIALTTHLVAPRPMDSPRAGLSPADVRRVQDFVRAHLCDDLSLIVLANLTGYSPHHFGMLFKQSRGMTVHQWVVRERIETARRLLRSSQLPLAQIARQVGFSSQSHFHLHFKRLLGLTPREYRRALSDDTATNRWNLEDLTEPPS